MTTNETFEQIISAAKMSGDAYPSGRLLPQPLDGQEWAQDGVVGQGERITVTYYFELEEITDAEERCPYNPAEEYPWDIDHVVYIADQDGDYIAGRNLAGFPA